MKLVIQRVKSASVRVGDRLIAETGVGFLILAGVGRDDDSSVIPWLARKTAELRIFEDENGKMNRSLQDIKGEALVVSQFTLLADCQKGRRPSFTDAALPDKAENFYETFASELANQGITVKKGIFGAYMQVNLINDGPVTVILEK
ncbi:MAG: D-tyrosyl-tRNA(Tyr) deacylase [Candidatus Cloacimonetes bacterium]|nr:D-tyrosyl-tRNA(Tyr) deacylase [Candidatus Cloacimonadota bacterium]